MKTTEIERGLARTVNRNLLKYAAGRAMFCPVCQVCMDWKKTVIATIHDKDGACLKSWTLCGKCYDKRAQALCDGTAQAGRQSGKTLSLEIVDGRKY